MKKNRIDYLINGGKQAKRALMSPPVLKSGLALFVAVIAFGLIGLKGLIAGAALAVFGFITFNTEGLEGEAKKLYDDLNKRIKAIPEKELRAALKDSLQGEVKDALKLLGDINNETSMTKLKEMLGEDDKGVRSILKKQGEAISDLMQKIEKGEKKLTVRSQVADWMKTNEAQLKAVIAGASKDVPQLAIRAAASPMTPSNTLSDTVTMDAGDVIRMGQPVFDLWRIQPTLWDLIPKGRTNLANYPWVNRKRPADTGNADYLAAGSPKPGISFTLEVEQSAVKKPAVSMKVATELLQDVDGMTNFITSELSWDLKNHINGIMMGAAAASATDPAGIRSFAVGYTLAGVQVQYPNNFDCIRAVLCQMKAAFVQGRIVVLVNPVDAANMDLTKSNEGVYLLPPFSTADGRQIAGALVIEDSNVAAGNVMAIAIDCLKTLMYQDFVIKWGWEDDDFTKNLVTVISEARFHQFHSENHAQGFVYDDFADIKSQIDATV